MKWHIKDVFTGSLNKNEMTLKWGFVKQPVPHYEQIITFICTYKKWQIIHCTHTHFCSADVSPSVRSRGLTFTWWGCCGLCFKHMPTKLAHSFLFCSCDCFCLYGSFNCISFIKLSRQFSAFSLFFPSHFCRIGPFNYISLYESLPQPWYNPLWLTGLKAPTN